MKLRTQWMLAFLLLAVVPLGAITLYSYNSSRRALRHTVEGESARLAEELNDRMTAVTASLSQRIDRLESLPLPAAGEGGDGAEVSQDPALIGRIVALLGASADYVDSFEFTPAPPAPPAPPAQAPAHGHVSAAPRGIPGHPMGARVVIPLPRVVSELARDPKIAPVLKLASSLMPAGEADKLRKELEPHCHTPDFFSAHSGDFSLQTKSPKNLASRRRKPL